MAEIYLNILEICEITDPSKTGDLGNVMKIYQEQIKSSERKVCPKKKKVKFNYQIALLLIILRLTNGMDTSINVTQKGDAFEWALKLDHKNEKIPKRTLVRRKTCVF